MASRSRCRTPVDSVWVNPKELALASDQLPRLAKALKRDKNELARRVTSNLDREFLYLARHMQPGRGAEDPRAGNSRRVPDARVPPLLPGGRSGRAHHRLHQRRRRRPGRPRARVRSLAGGRGRREARDPGSLRQDRAERRRDPRDAPGPQPRAVDRPAHPVSRVSRAESRDPRPAREVGLGRSCSTSPPAKCWRWSTSRPTTRTTATSITAKTYRNRAVTDIVEPGSIDQAVRGGRGLASGRFNDHSIIDTNPGYIKVGAKLLEDPHNLGAIDLATILAKSSNVGMTKVALSLEPRADVRHADRARLRPGDRPAAIPANRPACCLTTRTGGPVGISSMSRGYGLSITPLQLAHALRHRGGARRVARRSRSCASRRRPRASARSIPSVSRMLIHLLEAVVAPDGGGKQAAIPGYTVAGKTGTAWKATARRLRHRSISRGVRRHRAGEQSAPRGRRDHRRARCAASTTAATSPRPVFSGVVGGALRLLAVPPDRAGHATTAERRAPGGDAMNARRQLRRASPDCSTASPRCRATSRSSDLTQDGRAARARQRVPRGARQRRARPQVRAAGRRQRRARGAVGARAGARWFPICRRRSWSRRCRACANTPSTIADRFFGAPSRALAVAGITGTNGKTTCAYLLAQALEAAGRPAAYMGTIGTGPPARARSRAALTTGDAITVQRTLAGLRAGGAAQRRDGSVLARARPGARRRACASAPPRSPTSRAITSTITAPWRATAPPRRGCSRATDLVSRVINVDDAFGRAARHRSARARPRSSSRAAATSRTRAAPAGFVRAMHVTLSTRGIELEFDSSWGTGALVCPLVGDFNVDNLLTVIAVPARLGPARSSRSSARCRSVRAAPGRMETFGGTRAPLAVVDYAHTPDALRKALLGGARALRRPARRACSAAAAIAIAASARMMGAIAARARRRHRRSPTTIRAPRIRRSDRRGHRRGHSPPASRIASSTIARAPSARRWPSAGRATSC